MTCLYPMRNRVWSFPASLFPSSIFVECRYALSLGRYGFFFDVPSGSPGGPLTSSKRTRLYLECLDLRIPEIPRWLVKNGPDGSITTW